VKRALLPVPGIAAVQSVSAASESLEEALSQITDILRITELAALALALLIAFDNASINVEERRREQATMLAFGVRLRTVMGMAVAESVVTGVLGTAIGIGLGFVVLQYVISVLTPRVLPELGAVVSVAPGTLVLAVVLGVGRLPLRRSSPCAACCGWTCRRRSALWSDPEKPPPRCGGDSGEVGAGPVRPGRVPLAAPVG
jgi:ABC-type antimicrobial peptide transport system permease subunit